jgi:hypothetical protein
MVRAPTGFQRHRTTLVPSKELQQLPSPDLAAEQRSPARISAVRMKNILRDIQTDYANLQHGRLL